MSSSIARVTARMSASYQGFNNFAELCAGKPARHRTRRSHLPEIWAPDESSLRLFAEALALPGVERWQFDVARVQLAYGERLRRARATNESRPHLLAALETFERLGARPWAGRAASELRATGQARVRGDTSKRDALTPQELEIATLAASGLTNKQIGQRLYLSPRTVAAHLYRIFPKLGITTRAALRDALAAVTSSERNGDP